MLIFFVLLTLGFAFEPSKKALKINSRQYNKKKNQNKKKPLIKK